MDFSYYPNIETLANNLGKVKQTTFNKKNYAKAEEGWNRLGQDELAYINQAAPTAVRILDSYVMPNYILCMEAHILFVIPVRDVIWMYTSVVTARMNFIPYNKTHTLCIMDRTGENYTLGTRSTGGFSKKTPCGDAMQQVAQIILPQRKGMIVGWTEPIAKAMSTNFANVVQSVDVNSAQ